MDSNQQLIDFRKQKNEYFRSEGPLIDEQKQAFKGLVYYAPNPKFVFHSVPIKSLQTEEIIEIQTSAGDTQSYRKAGVIHFLVDGKEYPLSVYKDTDAFNPSYFLPFKDATNGKETYGAGRYIDIENNTIQILDFNYAYNPYCAYNDKWRCPITPEENRLSIPVDAGEKKFHE